LLKQVKKRNRRTTSRDRQPEKEIRSLQGKSQTSKNWPKRRKSLLKLQATLAPGFKTPPNLDKKSSFAKKEVAAAAAPKLDIDAHHELEQDDQKQSTKSIRNSSKKMTRIAFSTHLQQQNR
jgi:hypothetical protein